MGYRLSRKRWGIRFSSRAGRRRREITVLWSSWHREATSAYPGEPPRALLFMTRAAARAWCATEQARYATRQDSLRTWRFRPVRVIETIEVV